MLGLKATRVARLPCPYPLGRVYSSTAPCPPPKKSRSSASAAAGCKPPVIVYYRRRRKKPRLEEPRPSSPATAPRQPEEGALGRGSRRKRPLKHELLSLGSAPPALGWDGDGEELLRRRQPRRRVGLEKESTSAPQRRRRRSSQLDAASLSERWVEIQFSISSEEMKCVNLKFGTSNLDKQGYDELLALAVSFHDYQGLDHMDAAGFEGKRLEDG
ncbi:Trx1 [Hordeum vulgare]|nr:Trx1 [Hordeum vulgare]